MLSDQIFQRKEFFLIGMELFRDKQSGELDHYLCMLFRNADLVHEMFEFQLCLLDDVNDGELMLLQSWNVPYVRIPIFPTPPNRQHKKRADYLYMTCRGIYAESFVTTYRIAGLKNYSTHPSERFINALIFASQSVSPTAFEEAIVSDTLNS